MIPLPPDAPFLQTEDTLAGFIDGFEQGTLPKPMWTHSAHVAVAAWYLISYREAKATGRVRHGIRKYNEAVGTSNTEDSGYHETLTLFWLRIIAQRLSRADRPDARLDRIRWVVGEFGPQRDLFKKFYSFDVVRSREARAQWVPPDLHQIPREQE